MTQSFQSVRELRRGADHFEERLLTRAPFDGLSPSGLRTLVAESRIVAHGPGDVVWAAGAPAEHLILLLEGALQIEHPGSGELRGRVFALLDAPQLMGEAQAFHGHAFTGTGVAITPSVIGLVQPATVEKLILTEPEFALAYAHHLSAKLLEVIESRKHLRSEAPASTLARYLLEFSALASDPTERRVPPTQCASRLAGYASQAGGLLVPPTQCASRLAGYASQAGGLLVPLQQAELGRATGICRETVNRILKGWFVKGALTTSRGGVCILRPEQLELELDPSVPNLDPHRRLKLR